MELPADWCGLEASWQAVHAESLATLRQVSRSQGPSLEAAFLATLPAQVLEGLREAVALESEGLGAAIALLRELVTAHEVLLEEMYDISRQERADVAKLSPERAADRGEHGLSCSPADRISALSTALRAYEAELQVKQDAANAVRVGMPAPEMQALLISWEAQPMLEPVEALRAGLESQMALAASVRSTT